MKWKTQLEFNDCCSVLCGFATRSDCQSVVELQRVVCATLSVFGRSKSIWSTIAVSSSRNLVCHMTSFHGTGPGDIKISWQS